MPGVEIRILYSYHQRRRKEENMQQESERLNQENKLLKQSEELRALRETEVIINLPNAYYPAILNSHKWNINFVAL